MAKNTSITLGNHFDQFIHQLIQEGRYASASEVVRAALRLLESHEHQQAAMRSLAQSELPNDITSAAYASLLKEIETDMRLVPLGESTNKRA